MKKIYSLFDTISEQFGNPFISINDKTAIRSVDQFFDESDKQAKEHFSKPLCRSEFKLFCLGTWDESTGSISSCVPAQVSKWSTDGDEL